MPATASDRTDLGVPVLVVETETDMFLPALAYFPATQADGRGFRLWELPGTSHADGALLALTATEAERDIPGFTPGGCSLPANAGQESYVMNAAIDRLTRWVRTGSAPRGAPRMDISGAAFVRDKNGNVLGGVRTPAVDAPTATLTGEGNSGRGTLCFLAGTTTPLTVARLAALYPRHIDYVSAIGRSAAGAVAAGNLLPADALQIDEAAAASPVGLPAPAG